MSLNTKAGDWLCPTSAVEPGKDLQLCTVLNINRTWGYKSPHPPLCLFVVLDVVDIELKR